MSQEAAKQYLFVSNRDINIGSTLGYSIEFKRGRPTHVPRRMHSLVMERGCVPCDPAGKILDADKIQDPVEAPTVLLAPDDADERADKILEVVKALAKRNDAKSFSAGGVPTATAVSAALGWKVDQKEIRPVWDKFKREGKE